jgi:nucleotide-binding universal stress UspA family protein
MVSRVLFAATEFPLEALMYKHILVATDGSELATTAVTTGATMAKALGSKLTVVTVTEPWRTSVGSEVAVVFPADDYANAMSAHAKEVLAKADAIVAKTGLKDRKLLHKAEQFAAEGIVETATHEGCDLIVLASHGRRGLSRMLLGSQANRVVVQSHVPVLVCRS